MAGQIWRPIVDPEAIPFGVIGGLCGGLVIVVWWAFFSWAPRSERWGAIALMIAALIATSHLIHESLATSMMGMRCAIYAIPAGESYATEFIPEGSL